MNVPKLRFKEFSGEWIEKKLEDISSIKTGPFGSTLHQHDYVEFGTPIITVEHLGEQSVTHKNLPLVSDEDKYRLKSYTLREGDVVFSRVGSVDRSCFISAHENGWLFSGRLLRIRLSDDQFSSLFLNQIFKNETVKYRLRSVAVGQTMPSLNTEILKNFCLYFPPSLEEQTKIANFLTAVDDKIAELTKKVELLQRYKKGVMQQIFSQQLRFKDDDGQDFPEWEEKTLGSIASFYRGGQLSKSDINHNGMYACIHYGELFTTYHEVITEVKSKTNVLTNFSSKFGDILMPSSDVTPAGLAKASCILKGGVVLGGDINIIRVVTNMSPIFISYLLNFEKNKIIELVSGTTVKHIYIKDIKNILLTISLNIQEQTKIANFLSALDEQINTSQQQLELSKQYKQSLLQQMFI